MPNPLHSEPTYHPVPRSMGEKRHQEVNRKPISLAELSQVLKPISFPQGVGLIETNKSSISLPAIRLMGGGGGPWQRRTGYHCYHSEVDPPRSLGAVARVSAGANPTERLAQEAHVLQVMNPEMLKTRSRSQPQPTRRESLESKPAWRTKNRVTSEFSCLARCIWDLVTFYKDKARHKSNYIIQCIVYPPQFD